VIRPAIPGGRPGAVQWLTPIEAQIDLAFAAPGYR
jgi:hypothetical protein